MKDEFVDPAPVVAVLRSVLSAVDRGEVEATAPEVAYLTGAAEALEAIVGPSAPPSVLGRR